MADAEKKVVVKFTRDYVVDDERKGTADEESYAKGARRALVASSAAHFVSRGAAEYVKKN